ncbi:MAG: putative transport protein HsrA [Stenotrophomonas maltophilia]|nr:MAG: putative transport protein HsrA [Stenotrophomonas maltophilia]
MPLRIDRRTAVALLVAVVFFMENLDATVITTALPALARDFATQPAYLSVGVSAYLVALTVFIPISGWAAERYGARRIFSWAIVIFSLASLACAGASSLAGFTLARIAQGIGGAMMVPVGRFVVLRDTPKSEMVRAIAIITWPGLLAPVLGPVVGGWIATHWSWHWIFLLNLPIGVLALLAALRLLEPGHGSQRAPFDTLGFLLSGLGLGLFMGALELASRDDLPRSLALLVLLAAIGLLLACRKHLARVAHPLFDLAPLGIATFRVTAIGGSLFRTAIGSAPFLLPLMFQVGFGYSAVQAGALLLWLFAGNLCMKPATSWIMQRWGMRRVLLGNGLLVAAGFGLCALLQQDTPQVLVCALLFVSGMNRSMQFTALNTIAFADIPQPHMRDASTLFSVLQQLNSGMGIAIGALALSVASACLGLAPGAAGGADFRLAFAFMALLALLALVDAARLPASAGSAILQRR